MPGGSWCCCDCLQAADYFARTDAATLGAGWTESGGSDLGIDTERCYITTGHAYFNTPMPDPQGSFILSFTVDTPQDGDVYEVIISWDGGTTEKLRARFEVEDTTTHQWIQSLFVDGSEEIADDDEIIAGCNTWQEEFLSGRTFKVSYDRAVFRVGGTTPEYPHYELWTCVAPDTAADIRIGLQHGGGGSTIYFDDFEISDHYVHNQKCPAYGCVCGLDA